MKPPESLVIDNSWWFNSLRLVTVYGIYALLIQLAISRRRESLADASGVLLTRYPEGLISALQKIQLDTTPMATAKDSTAHMWLDTPFKGKGASWWHTLFATHPPIEQRIKALQQISV